MKLEDLPSRIFLDSSTLQTMLDFGNFIWDGVEIEEDNKIRQVPEGIEKLECLKNIVLVGQRASFEFALSQNSLKEVRAKGDKNYINWAYEMLDYWQSIIGEYDSSPFSNEDHVLATELDKSKFGYLGAGDKMLIRDAIILGCDAFLTMERKLPKNADHIQKELGLIVLSPILCWSLIKPWANLFI